MEKVCEKRKSVAKELAYIAMCTAIIAVCSWISIPMEIPFTMQTFGVFFAFALLGGRRATIAVAVYILLGAIGVPVFANFTGGFGVLFGVTGGYIMGFIVEALAMWLIEKLFGRKWWVMAIAMVIGLVLCYTFGTVWFVLLYTKTKGAMTIMGALSACVFPYIIPDLIKLVLALVIGKRLSKVIKLDR